ncbi:serpin family protein [bacterium]|nr:serpin family protein [bacterium]
MHKKWLYGFTVLMLLIMHGCTGINPTPTTGPTGADTPTEDTVTNDAEYLRSNLSRELSPDANPADISTLAADNTAFALDFYKQIRNADGNLVYSPFSLSLALTMAMAGAEGSTQTAMADALNLSLPEGRLYPAFDALLLAIEASGEQVPEEREGNPFQLNIANSLWGQTGFSFETAFLDTLAQYFGAGLHTVDYQQAPEAARQMINDWIDHETNGKITDLIPQGAIDSLTRLVLANAIYFNGSWYYPFDENQTEEASFYPLDGSETKVEMMRLNGERLAYASADGYQVVQLPYLSTDFVMTLWVPDSGNFEAFESGLTVDQITALRKQSYSQLLDLQMPKFDYESSTNANDPLRSLGMSEAFDPDLADFSGMSREDKLLITDVLHKSTITVDEYGTEAAAATAVIMGVTSAMPEEPLSLVIDRPFLFTIEHHPTGTILFMGRVLQP